MLLVGQAPLATGVAVPVTNDALDFTFLDFDGDVSERHSDGVEVQALTVHISPVGVVGIKDDLHSSFPIGLEREW